MTSSIYRMYTLAYSMVALYQANTMVAIVALGMERNFLGGLFTGAMAASSLIVPFYLLGRNISTYRKGEEMLPIIASSMRPWYFNPLMALVWLLALLALIALASFVIGLLGLPIVSLVGAFTLGPVHSLALPVLFLVEVLVAKNDSSID